MTQLMRPYQVKAKQAVLDELAAGVNEQLLVKATGLGKTFLGRNIIQEFRKALWITHVEELIIQSSKALSGIPAPVGSIHEHRSVGIVKAERFDIHADIVVASAQTLHRRLDRIDPYTFDIVICDEAHLFMAKSFIKSVEHFKPSLRLGLTATPFRLDGMPLNNLFAKTVFEYNIGEGIRDGYLCEMDGIRVKTNINLDTVRTTGGELNSADLQIINCPERNNLIVDSYLQYAPGRQAIAFCNNVQHAIDLCKTFQRRGISAGYVVSDENLTPDRTGMIQAYKEGKFQVLCNVAILTAGFDHPNTGCIITAAPTKSRSRFLQQVGRGTRLKDEHFVALYGQKCILLDVVDMTTRHSLVNSITEDAGKKLEDKIFITAEKKQKIKEYKEEQQRKLQVTSKVDKKVDLFKLPEQPELSTSVKMQDPATPAQLKWIADLGYDVINQEYTKYMASEIISSQQAAEWQLKNLRKWGYEVPPVGCSIAIYQKAKNEYEKREQEKSYMSHKPTVQLPFNDL